jgi:uncharacterized protein (TIGR03000 family)
MDSSGYGATGYGFSGWGQQGGYGATGFGWTPAGFNPFALPCSAPCCPPCGGSPCCPCKPVMGFSGWMDSSGYGATGYGFSGWGQQGGYGATGFGGSPAGFNPFVKPCACLPCCTCASVVTGGLGGHGGAASAALLAGRAGLASATVPAGYAERTPAALPRGSVRPTQATVVVELPADAVLYVDGRRSTLTSGRRIIVTPALDARKQYSYTVKAEALRNGRLVEQTRKVNLRAGQVTRVRLSLSGSDAERGPMPNRERRPDRDRKPRPPEENGEEASAFPEEPALAPFEDALDMEEHSLEEMP